MQSAIPASEGGNEEQQADTTVHGHNTLQSEDTLNTIEEDEQKHIVSDNMPGSSTSVPIAPLTKCYYMLHLFSGQRRHDDFQHKFETYASAHNLCVIVLSIDIVLHAKLGDLTRDDSIAMWINLLIAGYILGVLGGPPCETWCAARFLSLLFNGKPGPRALRSKELPWALLD